MNQTTCAAIAAYISAAVSKAHVDRDLSETMEHGTKSDVEQADRELYFADEYLDTCFQALPAELQAFLNESTY